MAEIAASPDEHDLQAITRIVRSAIIRIAFSVRRADGLFNGRSASGFNRCFDSAWTRETGLPSLAPLAPTLLSRFCTCHSSPGNGKLDSVCWRCIRAAISGETVAESRPPSFHRLAYTCFFYPPNPRLPGEGGLGCCLNFQPLIALPPVLVRLRSPSTLSTGGEPITGGQAVIRASIFRLFSPARFVGRPQKSVFQPRHVARGILGG